MAALRLGAAHVEVQQHRQLVVAHQHLGGVALHQLQATARVRTAVQQVAGVDEGVLTGSEAAVVQGLLYELGMTVRVA